MNSLGSRVCASRVVFCGFSFERTQGKLSLGNEQIHLEHQQAKILNLLIENQDKVVSRDQIAEHVWQGVIVEDNTISKAITRLRKVLNDDAKSAKIIKTVPKRGYQFIAPVQEVQEVQHHSRRQSAAGPRKTPFYIRATACVIVILLLISLIIENKYDDTWVPAGIPKPISFREGVELNAHLHGDGRHLLFIGDTGDGHAIYTKNVGDAHSKQAMPVNSLNVYPKWLNKDEMSFVFSDLDSEQQCFIFSASASLPTTPAKLTNCASDEPVEVFVSAQDHLYWTDNAGSWEFDLVSGSRTALPFDFEQAKFQMPSPNGEYWATLTDSQSGSLLSVYPWAGTTKVMSKQLPYVISHFKWAHDSTGLFHLGEHPAHQLFSLSLDGQQKLLATTSLGTMTQVSDVQMADSIEFVIRSVDLDVHQLHQGIESKIINSPFPDYNPAKSPKSGHLAFASKRTGSAQVWVQYQSGLLEQISRFDRASYLYDIAWSPNEKTVLVKRNDSILLIDVETQNTVTLPVNARDKHTWQWLTNNKLAYVDAAADALFTLDTMTHHAELIKSDVGFAYVLHDNWFVSDSAGKSVVRYNSDFSQLSVVTDKLSSRPWRISDGLLYLVNNDGQSVSLVSLDDKGMEQTVLSGNFNPRSLRSTAEGGFLFHRMNRHEANIYQLSLK